MEMIKGWVLVYDPPIVDVPMIAIADREVRRWRRDVRVGLRSSVLAEMMDKSKLSLTEAEWLLDTVLAQFNEARKECHVRYDQPAI